MFKTRNLTHLQAFVPTYKASLLSGEAANSPVGRPCRHGVQMKLMLCTLCTLCTPWRSGSRVVKSARHCVDIVSPLRRVASRLSLSPRADRFTFRRFVKLENRNKAIGPKRVEMLQLGIHQRALKVLVVHRWQIPQGRGLGPTLRLD